MTPTTTDDREPGRSLDPRWAGLTLAAVLAVTFALLGTIVEVRGSMPGDEATLEALYDAFGTSLDDAMVAVGAATDTVPIIAMWVVSTLALRSEGRSRDALHFLVLVVVVMAGNRLLKELFARPRPSIRVAPESTSTYSFPSGHASNSIAVMLGLLLVVRSATRRRWLLAVGVPAVVLVGFSRLAIAVHYPSDVLAAWLWVGAWTATMWALRSRPEPMR